jgi:peptidoglycan/LPS O-acetylase OafA/YrhL
MSFENYTRRKYLPELDGLRAISVLMVITCHMHWNIWRWVHGASGVTVFFVTSGYLITTLALREEETYGQVSIRAFYIRRAFRIFPLYYFILAVYWILIFGLGVDATKQPALRAALPYHLFYLQEIPFFSWTSRPEIPFYQTWSLGIEEKFYFVWPVLAFLVLAGTARLRARRLPVVSILMILILAFALVPGTTPKLLFPYFHILVGCLLALVMNERRWFEKLAWCQPNGVYLFGVLGVAIQLSLPNFGDRMATLLTALHALVIGAFISQLISAVSGPALSVFRRRILVLIGKVSYGVYLVHILAIRTVERVIRPSSGNILALVCCVSVFVAYMLWSVMERPLIDYGRRWSEHVLSSSSITTGRVRALHSQSASPLDARRGPELW